MFFQDDIYIPPCCDQKFFRQLFGNLTERETTDVIFPGGDYSLSSLLDRICSEYPRSVLTLCVPSFSGRTLDTLCKWMERHWHAGQSDGWWIRHLHLVIGYDAWKGEPSETETGSIVSRMSVYAGRLQISTAPVTETVILMEHAAGGQTHTVSIHGSIHQTAGTGIALADMLTVSSSSAMYRQLSTVMRVNTQRRTVYPERSNKPQ